MGGGGCFAPGMANPQEVTGRVGIGRQTRYGMRHVLENFDSEDVSRSSGCQIRFGDIPDGREIAVVFEWIDDVTL